MVHQNNYRQVVFYYAVVLMNFYVVAVYYQLLVLLELIQHSVLHRFVAVAADEQKKKKNYWLYISLIPHSILLSHIFQAILIKSMQQHYISKFNCLELVYLSITCLYTSFIYMINIRCIMLPIYYITKNSLIYIKYIIIGISIIMMWLV